jgi:glycosyltransferase involved in cell wall biosynthesis
MPHGDPSTLDGNLSVAFVSSYGVLGGSEIYLERLLRLVPRSSVRSVISLGAGTLVERISALGFELDVIPTSRHPWSIAASSWKVRRRLLKLRPDVVHANGLKAAIVSVLAAGGTRVPVIWVRHDFSWEGWRARALASRCRRVICVSQALTRTFPRAMANKIDVVHTGIPDITLDREDARQQVLRAIGDQTASPLVSLVGHLIPGKGHLELVEIAPRLLEEMPSARLLLVGDQPSELFGDYVGRLHERVAGLGVAHAVTFLGHRDDALTVIAASDLVVMPSVSEHPTIETEGFPLIALEALAVGTPVVAYATGGLPELLADCGTFVAPGDREGLLQAILSVATDRPAWERLSRCSQMRARASFRQADMVRKLDDVYRSARR